MKPPRSGQWLCAVATAVFSASLGVGVAAGQVEPPLEAALAKGIALVEEGDYGAAIIALDDVVARLGRLQKQKERVARAQLYLGIAYVGEGAESLATASFREALKHDPTLTLDPEQFSPKVRERFQRVKNERGSARPAPSSAASSEIAFVSVEPPHGSRVSLSKEGPALRVVATVTHTKTGTYRLFATNRHQGGTQRECVCGVSDPLSVVPGQRIVATVALQSPCGGSTPGCPSLPFDSTGLAIHMYRDDPGELIVIPETVFPVTHTFTR
jgi:hypothetical protein